VRKTESIPLVDILKALDVILAEIAASLHPNSILASWNEPRCAATADVDWDGRGKHRSRMTLSDIGYADLTGSHHWG
jgi:hypothetical protein